MTDREGTPLAVLTSAANEHDINLILPLVYLGLLGVGGKRGRQREFKTTLERIASILTRLIARADAVCEPASEYEYHYRGAGCCTIGSLSPLPQSLVAHNFGKVPSSPFPLACYCYQQSLR